MNKNIEQKIIEAAIGCIERYGIENVTNKLIGDAAGVNSAAISYYFRGKDNLIELARQTALQNGFEWADYAHTDGLDAKCQLVEVLLQLGEGALCFPNLTRSFFLDAFLRGDYSGLGIKKLNEFLSLVCEKLCAKCPHILAEDMRLLIYRAFSCTVLPVFTMPKLLDEFSSLDLTDRETYKKNIDTVVERLFMEG